MSPILPLVPALVLAVAALAAQPAQRPDPAPAPAAKAPEPATDLSGLDAKALRDLIAQLQRGRQEDAERIAKLEAEVKALKEQVDKAAKPGSDKPAPARTPTTPPKDPSGPDPSKRKPGDEMGRYLLTARDIELEGRRWTGQLVALEKWTFRSIDNDAVKFLKGLGDWGGGTISGTATEIEEKWIGFAAADPSGKRMSYFFAEKAKLGDRLKAWRGGESITITGRVFAFRDGNRHGVFVYRIE